MIPPCTSTHRPSLQLPLVPTQVTPFHSSRPPAITVKSYLEDRILKYAGCSEETFILALIYMDQVRTIASAPRGNTSLACSSWLCPHVCSPKLLLGDCDFRSPGRVENTGRAVQP